MGLPNSARDTRENRKRAKRATRMSFGSERIFEEPYIIFVIVILNF
jgi:hypothetical protein